MRRPLLITSPPKFKDKHIWEKIVNIVTCIPFALVGRKVAKRGKYSKLYNYSMCGTALAAGLYHTSEHPKVGTLEFLFFCCCFCALFSLTRLSSPGGTNQAFMCVCVCVCVCVCTCLQLRNPLRRLDYCTIAASAVAFTLAARERETPRALLALTAAVIPFQPILVMACHVAEIEVVRILTMIHSARLCCRVTEKNRKAHRNSHRTQPPCSSSFFFFPPPLS